MYPQSEPPEVSGRPPMPSFYGVRESARPIGAAPMKPSQVIRQTWVDVASAAAGVILDSYGLALVTR